MAEKEYLPAQPFAGIVRVLSIFGVIVAILGAISTIAALQGALQNGIGGMAGPISFVFSTILNSVLNLCISWIFFITANDSLRGRITLVLASKRLTWIAYVEFGLFLAKIQMFRIPPSNTAEFFLRLAPWLFWDLSFGFGLLLIGRSIYEYAAAREQQRTVEEILAAANAAEAAKAQNES